MLDINELLANNISGGFIDIGSNDLDFSNIGQLPADGINSGEGDFSLEGLISLEVLDKIELINEVLIESWIEDPRTTDPTYPHTEEPVSRFIEDRYEEELLFVSLEI